MPNANKKTIAYQTIIICLSVILGDKLIAYYKQCSGVYIYIYIHLFALYHSVRLSYTTLYVYLIRLRTRPMLIPYDM